MIYLGFMAQLACCEDCEKNQSQVLNLKPKGVRVDSIMSYKEILLSCLYKFLGQLDWSTRLNLTYHRLLNPNRDLVNQA
jgi:hypothetical protein